MFKKPKKIADWIIWFAGLFAIPWVTIVTSLVAAGLTILGAGLKWISLPSVHGAILVFMAFLWTIIGLVWLGRRKPKDVEYLRYGLTFEGIFPNLDINATEHALQFGVALRNFSPSPIRYFIEEFEVKIESRTLANKYIKDSLTSFLPRGAQRVSSNISFKKDHIKEFFGKRVEGTLDFSIIYGDADRKPVRRLRMSLQLILVFPNQSDPLPVTLGFISPILAESDKPIEL